MRLSLATCINVGNRRTSDVEARPQGLAARQQLGVDSKGSCRTLDPGSGVFSARGGPRPKGRALFWGARSW